MPEPEEFSAPYDQFIMQHSPRQVYYGNNLQQHQMMIGYPTGFQPTEDQVADMMMMDSVNGMMMNNLSP